MQMLVSLQCGVAAALGRLISSHLAHPIQGPVANISKEAMAIPLEKSGKVHSGLQLKLTHGPA